MPSANSLGGRIRTNIPSQLAYNTLRISSNSIAKSLLRVSTGRRVNSATDDISGYITSRSLSSRNSTLEVSLMSNGEATNVASISQNAYDNIHNLISEIARAAQTASAGSLGTTEKVALARGAYHLAEQIDLVANSASFGGRQLLDGSFNADWLIGIDANNNSLDINLDLTPENADLNVDGNFALELSSNEKPNAEFAGIEGLDLSELNEVSNDNLGIFSDDRISTTIKSLSDALSNVANVGAYVGGFQTRLYSQRDSLLSQITNYKGAISRIDDANVALEQLNLSKQQFLLQSSIISISQSNTTPFNYFRLLSN